MTYIINGMGLSGLAYYDASKSKDDIICIDKNIEIGGYTRTTRIDGFQFDYTGHFLHLKNKKHPSEIGLNGDFFKNDWMKIKNKSGVFINGKICEAPYQYNFRQLGKKYAEKCINSFLKIKGDSKNSNLKEFYINNFGKFMADSFFIPYNEKLLSTNLENLDPSQLGRFFPKLDRKAILDENNKDDGAKKTYNSEFWYPKSGGIDLLLRHFKRPEKTLFNKIKEIDIKRKEATLSDESKISYEKFINTINLKELLCLIKDLPKDIKKLKNNLSSSYQYSVYLGVKKPINLFKEFAWLYIPDKKTNVYRIGNFTFASKAMASFGEGMSLYIELSNKSLDPIMDAKNFMINNFSLSQDDIVALAFNKLDPGYVHFKKNNNENINIILSWLKENHIFSIGRYGKWTYLSMEDCILSAVKLAQEI